MSDDAAALLEPLSVGVWAVRKARLGSGSSVLVAGAGPIGIMTVVAARAAGATDIVVSDPVASRRAAVMEFGATKAIDPAAGDTPMTVDAFIDCSGAPVAVRSGLRAVAPGGWVVLVGTGAEEMELPLSVIQARELNVTGVFRYVDTWPAATAIAASGEASLDALVTARYGLDQVREALESGQPGGMKSIVEPWR
ncbi:MAG TPA: zinc-binding dehydrogenase [Streptosporangiaceae bacterium]|nr:zinc-binding dehydrogenase [Streptosporangiaceae bacterium]